jgi:hypothetical protein
VSFTVLGEALRRVWLRGAVPAGPPGLEVPAVGGAVLEPAEIAARARRFRLPGRSAEDPRRQPLHESARYEIKMLSGEWAVPAIRGWLMVHPVGFRRAWAPRTVNSIYFDSPQLDRYAENLAGVAERRKVRLRWYGEDVQRVKVTFEVKCKRGRVGWKLAHTVAEPLDLDQRWRDLLGQVRAGLPPAFQLYLDGAGGPVLLIRYRREYYSTFDGRVRATLDYEQHYYDQRVAAAPNRNWECISQEYAVVEFKAPPAESERLARAVALMPLRVTRGSKYVRGIETLLGYELFHM